MDKLIRITVFVASGLMALPAHAAPIRVPEIGASGAFTAATIVLAVAAIIIERRRK